MKLKKHSWFHLYGKFLVPKVSPAPYKQKPQPRMLFVTPTSTSDASRHPPPQPQMLFITPAMLWRYRKRYISPLF
ncbi:Uncharacterized protein APZ42_000721 [Daphnia magna]|uniref:Uncharacterized protein n=1 Tax=Daphnia magna TaxID=35525 RepID=A0A164JFJ6_9CRUS|nr:Uncharacterized protein APZ42_000721 [Daphnia magna]